MSQLTVIGVRHHSPACARLVEAALQRLKPRFVLIEGPADMNERMLELRLPHRMPIAVFSWYRHEDRTMSSWTPFCRHSPEWIALTQSLWVGAEARFMDLPAWDKVFLGVQNRYSDSQPHRRAGDQSFVERLCQKLEVDDFDALWDHLFEQPQTDPWGSLQPRLTHYFKGLRCPTGEPEAPGSRDEPREAFMAASIRRALKKAQGAPVLVVCGGFHAPALWELQPDELPLDAPWPEPPLPEIPTDTERNAPVYGSYLVPYSFKRLDSFTGYEAGLPSPFWYDTLYERGPEGALEVLLNGVAARLRAKKQPVSTADLIACLTSAQGLARLRGHPSPSRNDLLDGIAVSLVKDGMEVPLPWSRRGTLPPRTDPILVEVVSVFSGTTEGLLATGTPRPPLCFDIEEQLAAAGLSPSRLIRNITLNLLDLQDRGRSRILHRLKLLNIPGFKRISTARCLQLGTGDKPDFSELWEIVREDDLDSSMIEASAWGATLEGACARRLEELLTGAAGLAERVQILDSAVFTGITLLALQVLMDVAILVHQEPDFGVVGEALGTLLGIWRHAELFEAAGAEQLGVVIEAAFDRALWLLEGILGPDAPAGERALMGILALRDVSQANRKNTLSLPAARASGVMSRRALDPEAPPDIRGAALGYCWSLQTLGPDQAEAQAVAAIRGAARPDSLGDFLVGLFTLARAEIVGSLIEPTEAEPVAPPLLKVLDELFTALDEDAFLLGLPSLRLAFSRLPPQELQRIAQRILLLHGKDPAEARSLLSLKVEPSVFAAGTRLDSQVAAYARRFGLVEQQ